MRGKESPSEWIGNVFFCFFSKSSWVVIYSTSRTENFKSLSETSRIGNTLGL